MVSWSSTSSLRSADFFIYYHKVSPTHRKSRACYSYYQLLHLSIHCGSPTDPKVRYQAIIACALKAEMKLKSRKERLSSNAIAPTRARLSLQSLQDLTLLISLISRQGHSPFRSTGNVCCPMIPSVLLTGCIHVPDRISSCLGFCGKVRPSTHLSRMQ